MKSVYLLEDGTIGARIGTNGNCGGVGTIRVRIRPNRSGAINFLTADFECEHLDGFGHEVAGARLPAFIREDIFAGAADAFQELNTRRGIDFELIHASLNISDFPGKKFWTAGSEAVRFWFDGQTLK